MADPESLSYSADLYTWVAVSGDEATIGFTNYSLDRMEEMVAVELKAVGEEVEQGQPCGSVDVMKALIDIPAPISGGILATNGSAAESPDSIRDDPFGNGWLLKMRVRKPAELADLLSRETYLAKGGT